MNSRSFKWAVVVGVLGLAWVCQAADYLTGTARVIDADTLEVVGERVRLTGIDAPELGQRRLRTHPDGLCGDGDQGRGVNRV